MWWSGMDWTYLLLKGNLQADEPVLLAVLELGINQWPWARVEMSLFCLF